QTAHGGAVAADVFGRRVHHDIGAPLERPAQIGRGDRVVDHERDARFAGDLPDRLDVDDVDERIAERLGVQDLRVLLYRAAEILRVVRVDEGGVDAELAQIDLEQRIGAAVAGVAGNDVVAPR